MYTPLISPKSTNYRQRAKIALGFAIGATSVFLIDFVTLRILSHNIVRSPWQLPTQMAVEEVLLQTIGLMLFVAVLIDVICLPMGIVAYRKSRRS